MQIKYEKVPLGEGRFGSVFPGKYKGRKVAVKRVALYEVNDNEEKTLQQLNHPNVIKLFHSESNDEFKYFAMELCAASLDQLFLKPDHPRKYKGPALPPHSTVFLQLASGLEYIHSKKLIHRDIKPGNVLIFIDSTGQVIMKWADFGLSKFVNERGTCTLSGIKGTEYYFAPELLKSKEELGRGTVKSDVFAFALVIGYLLLDGQHLYGSKYDIPSNILKKNKVNMDKIDRSHYARHLLKKMLKAKPGERISSTEVVKELVTIKIEIAEKEFRELFNNNNLDLNQIKLLIKNGIDVNGKDLMGRNALHNLCKNNSSEKLIDAIKILIQNGIDVNEKDNYGENALHLLCGFNSSEKLIDGMQILIQNGIDVNGKDNNERNALHHLCSNNSSEKIIDAIQFLIQNGIDVNEKSNDEWNALHWLCWTYESEKIVDVIQFLIKHGIDVNAKENEGRNAFHMLCCDNTSEKLIDAIQFLIQNGIDVNEKDNEGRNAFHLLCCHNTSEKLIDAIDLLIENGIDVNGKDNEGRNALHLMCSNNSNENLIDAIQFLMAHGIQSNGIDARSLLSENYHYRNKTETIEEIIHLLDRTAITN